MGINEVVLLGRIATDIELKTTTNSSYVKFNVAIDRFVGKDDRKTDFIPCIAWSKTAEFISQFFKKGNVIALAGGIITGSYEDKDGYTVKTFEVLIDKVTFTGESKKTDEPKDPTPPKSKKYR